MALVLLEFWGFLRRFFLEGAEDEVSNADKAASKEDIGGGGGFYGFQFFLRQSAAEMGRIKIK
eukprot:CAMPEP_0118665632 /NCGR_PEP_ID=MMETSP0785-20121206/18729_1 /TAXON_ID=91992 /ORGANISM="Bolidomonas pacifica, Strain CCMP 1866" /LENGTH=62 /DNA_ID=CAMNT_0006559777 /DNA_START=327 /DNA_END=515 /DNA_ORIENTATION=-